MAKLPKPLSYLRDNVLYLTPLYFRHLRVIFLRARFIAVDKQQKKHKEQKTETEFCASLIFFFYSKEKNREFCEFARVLYVFFDIYTCTVDETHVCA